MRTGIFSPTRLLKISGIILISLIIISSFFLPIGYHQAKSLVKTYQNLESAVVVDRKGEEIFLKPNDRGYWARYLEEIPPRLKELLLIKEDKYFYYHPGFNPISLTKYLLGGLGIGDRKASSTITQQLTKILLGTESERSLKNKLKELSYALSLELFLPKEEILKMYVNSLYLGNQAQGFKEASRLYFNLPPELLNEGQILQLLATISNPTFNNPARIENRNITLRIGRSLGVDLNIFVIENSLTIKEKMRKYNRYSLPSFEIASYLKESTENQELTVDFRLTDRIREIVKRNLDELKWKSAYNSAVIVIKLPENEILSLVGSPDPLSSKSGYQINMLLEPRAVGSTIKPFIYLKAFEKGLRPYTMIDDREYKYLTAMGLPLYPRNYDEKYRGVVNLHYALSNSLNVPAVKVLEYIRLNEFYQFMEEELGFKPIQPWESYQLGIALGGLEMSLLDLSHYFTIFPNQGVLKELQIYRNEKISITKQVVRPEYVELINKILQDRSTGVEQFGMRTVLNLFPRNYALKTGTSRDYRDSWVIGYTPDFLVGVWVGNSNHSPMDEVTGQVGAGLIWSEVMELLFNSAYNLKTPFTYSHLKEFSEGNSIQYGLKGDDYDSGLNVLIIEDSSLILSPHQEDTFLLEKGCVISLRAREEVRWSINENFLAESKEARFIPSSKGFYQIQAENLQGKREIITIEVRE